MTLDFPSALADLALLSFQLLGLLSEAGGGRFHFRMSLFEARLVPAHIAFHFRQLTLPGDELLAEGGDGDVMLVAGAAKPGGLLPDLFGFLVQLASGGFERFLALLDIGVKLGEVVVELLADNPQMRAGISGLFFPSGKLPL